MIIPTRWTKIFKDVWSHKSRSLLVILSIGVGVAAAGMIQNASNIIQRDLYSAFAAGNPAVLEIHVSPFSEDLASAVEGLREVDSAQARRLLSATILPGEGRVEEITLNVVPQLDELEVNRISLETGSAYPRTREILLERQSAERLDLAAGDRVTLELGGSRRYTLRVSGSAHDLYVMPFALLGEANGYINMETLEWMGEAPYYDRLDIALSGEQLDKPRVLEIGEQIRERVIEPAGYGVIRMGVPGVGSDPGEHWAQNQIRGFLLILQIMGVMVVLLSAGLIVNTVSAILGQQIRQIGIMRSMGAVRRQVIGMYLFNVLIYSLLGLFIAIPLGLLGAWWLSGFAAGFLNFDLARVDLPAQVVLAQVGLGLLMPILVAIVPILAGTRFSVYHAIYQYGLAGEEKGGWIERLFRQVRRLDPAVMLPLRNTFRKKERLAFTLVTLTLAGATFISVFSTRASLTSQIQEVGRYLLFDASLNLSAGANQRTVEREALRIPGVSVAEGWAASMGVIERPDGSQSEQVEIVGLPHDARTIDPLLLEGAWLSRPGADQVVINADLLDAEPGLRAGSQIVLKTGEARRTYQVIGVVSKHLSGARIYMDFGAYNRLTGRQNQVDVVRLLATPGAPGSPAEQDRLAEQLEERFRNAGLSAQPASPRHAFYEKFTDVFDLILIVLVIMAILLAVVGGLGLTGTMGMNVLERTREIGVLRALGASNLTVRQVVVIEGMVVALLSWLAGAFLSGPSGLALAAAVIGAVLQASPSYRYSLTGLFAWLALVVLIGVVASLAPALNASRLKVREVLDYE